MEVVRFLRGDHIPMEAHMKMLITIVAGVVFSILWTMPALAETPKITIEQHLIYSLHLSFDPLDLDRPALCGDEKHPDFSVDVITLKNNTKKRQGNIGLEVIYPMTVYLTEENLPTSMGFECSLDNRASTTLVDLLHVDELMAGGSVYDAQHMEYKRSNGFVCRGGMLEGQQAFSVAIPFAPRVPAPGEGPEFAASRAMAGITSGNVDPSTGNLEWQGTTSTMSKAEYLSRFSWTKEGVCQQMGKDCSVVWNKCLNRNIPTDCGSCPSGQVCGTTQPNVCGSPPTGGQENLRSAKRGSVSSEQLASAKMGRERAALAEPEAAVHELLARPVESMKDSPCFGPLRYSLEGGTDAPNLAYLYNYCQEFTREYIRKACDQAQEPNACMSRATLTFPGFFPRRTSEAGYNPPMPVPLSPASGVRKSVCATPFNYWLEHRDTMPKENVKALCNNCQEYVSEYYKNICGGKDRCYHDKLSPFWLTCHAPDAPDIFGHPQ
jgi:hypothetical protein